MSMNKNNKLTMSLPIIVIGIYVASIISADEQEPRLPESSFYRQLGLAAKRLRMILYVFTAEGWQPRTRELFGYQWQGGRWLRRPCPLPDVVYDRRFFTDSNKRRNSRDVLTQIKEEKPHILLNSSLPAKLNVYDALKQDERLTAYLPATLPYRSASQLEPLLESYPAGLVLKPEAGMHGLGVIHMKVNSEDNRVHIHGRTRSNMIFTKAFSPGLNWKQWVERAINRIPYIVQPYLPLSDKEGMPFDIRALLQKNEQGLWRLSGIAARRGAQGGLTSNLHGGGGALPPLSLLEANYGKPHAERLLEHIHMISEQAAEQLESRFGRFAELGFDFGIEPDGRLWLLEANSKPGRASFRLIGDDDAGRHSIERPLLYARFIARRLYATAAVHESANGRQARDDKRQRPFNVQEVHR
ncbi:glutathione synthase/RimK-type ligase-like ATP-grasp enzyme [Paenibacillus harenae]|uniref:Glutathione synthase/RimK-type ligase-like ATP-grasp enzyme n=2 Tax=Paenibacillus harenae TaxID=306543 RepID=A0ABT9TUB8_PAEHA|nr:glutathione synthase/RimK-type ligase-like ATP-grasp enzyme [Paenibacillus harenae]